MRIEVPYGGSTQTAELANADRVRILSTCAPVGAEHHSTLRQALKHPVGAPPLHEFAGRSQQLVVIVNDATRATPTAQALEFVHHDLANVDDLSLVVATGTHRAPTDDELRNILGGLSDFWMPRAHVHDARDASGLVSVGTTSRGNEVLLNRRVVEADSLLVIGSVEPHYFAGYTGGRKSFLPGVAAYETVERNHALAMEPASRPAALDGNPVHDEMMEAVALMAGHPVWSVATVSDAEHRIVHAAAGGLNESFGEAVRAARSVFEVPVDCPFDIVVAVAPPPMDRDLYQAHKALEHGNLALREGGIIILVSECAEGIGQTSFAEILEAAATPTDAARVARAEYRLGNHKVARIASMACRAEIWAVTGIDGNRLKSIFMRPFGNLQSALEAALERLGPDARVLVMPDASVTVPVPR